MNFGTIKNLYSLLNVQFHGSIQTVSTMKYLP